MKKMDSSIIFASTFLCITIFIFGPFHLYFSNILDFKYHYLDVFCLFIGFAIVFEMLFVLTYALLKGRYREYLVIGVFILAVLLWFQGNVMSLNYGAIDGNNIVNWNEYIKFEIFDALIWISSLVLAFLYINKIKKYIKTVSIFFILMQLISMILVYMSSPQISEYQTLENSKAVSELSSEENIMIVIFDGFESGLFMDIIEENGESKKIFDGFTLYKNAIGGFPITYPSIPLILSGKYYDNSVPIHDFIGEEIQESLPSKLMKLGYQVDLISSVPKTIRCNEYSVATNCLSLNSMFEVNNFSNGMYLMALTSFRYSPHFIKRHIYNGQQWFVSSVAKDKYKASILNDFEFLDWFNDNSEGNADKPTFKFIHFTTPHPPYLLDSNCEFTDISNEMESYKEQASCAIIMMKKLINNLEEKNLFDQTAIYFIADHGNRFYTSSSIENNITDEMVGLSMPLFLVKPISGAGDLQVSELPVSLGDIPKTILPNENFPGEDINKMGQDSNRIRSYYYYQDEKNKDDHIYFPPLSEYKIKGFPWDKKGWEKSGKIIEPKN